MRRFFRGLLPKKEEGHRVRGASSSKATGNDDVEVREELSPVTEPRTNESCHIEAETVIQHAGDVIAHTDDITVSAQDAEIHAQHAEIDVADVHVQEAHVQVQYANKQNVQVNQEIDTLIQHADEVHAEVVHAENVGTILHQHVHHPAVPEPSKENVDKLVKEFCNNVKERSLKETSGGVADSYREQNLTEPVKEYTPRLKKIKFYRGDWVPKKKKTLMQRMKRYIAKKRPEQEDTSQEPNQEYVKENVFALEENHKEGEDILKHEILHFIEKMETQRYKAIVGQAGSGKTTLMKRIARDVIRGKLLIQKGQNEPFEPEFVHYLNIRDIPVSEMITPCDLLFGQVLAELDEDALEHGFKWLRKNQKKAVFFLDGLDQATWSLQGNSDPIRYKVKASTSTIMENLLKGNLFPNVLIIISSREHALSPLTGNLRPHEIIGLAGFTMEDRKQVFIGLAGEDGENLWNLMCAKSPALVPLASIPIFLVFIVIIYKFDPENPPDTMSGIMTKILQIFLQSDHAHERENIMEILKGLKQMSFKGTEEGRVLFTHKDLEKFNLIPKKVRDLVVFVPGSTLLGKNLMDGHYRLFFCHQSIQELLSALSIIEKNLEAFTKFVNESLHEDHWSVVRRFVCGVLMNEETYNEAKDGDLIDVSDVADKRRILKQSLSKQLQSSRRQYRQQLELFASLYESNDSEFIQSNVHEIDINEDTDTSLTPNDMHVISSILRRCSQVELVRLASSNLNPETIEILNAGLQTSQLKIKTLDVSINFSMGTDGCKTIGLIVHRCQVEDLKMWWCNLSIDEVKELQEGLANSKIKSLDVGWNDNMGTDGWKTIGAIVHRCQVEDLKIGSCDLSTDEIKGLQEGLANSKIKILEYSVPWKSSPDKVQAIADLVHRCHLQNFVLGKSSRLSSSDKDLIKQKAGNTEIVFKD